MIKYITWWIWVAVVFINALTIKRVWHFCFFYVLTYNGYPWSMEHFETRRTKPRPSSHTLIRFWDVTPLAWGQAFHSNLGDKAEIKAEKAGPHKHRRVRARTRQLSPCSALLQRTSWSCWVTIHMILEGSFFIICLMNFMV